MSFTSTSGGNSRWSAASISPRSSRRVGWIHGSPRRSYTSSSVSATMSAPDLASNSPYSESFRPLRTAISRVLMLWAFEAVKYCSAAPQQPGGTTRRSTWRPLVVRMEVLVSPRAMTRST